MAHIAFHQAASRLACLEFPSPLQQIHMDLRHPITHLPHLHPLLPARPKLPYSSHIASWNLRPHNAMSPEEVVQCSTSPLNLVRPTPMYVKMKVPSQRWSVLNVMPIKISSTNITIISDYVSRWEWRIRAIRSESLFRTPRGMGTQCLLCCPPRVQVGPVRVVQVWYTPVDHQ